MIGADLIDLNKAQFLCNNRLNRYWNKITSPEERSLYKPDFELLWILWGLKESVYKAESRRAGVHIFSPASIACRLTKSGAIATYKDQAYYGSYKSEHNKITVRVKHSSIKSRLTSEFLLAAQPNLTALSAAIGKRFKKTRTKAANNYLIEKGNKVPTLVSFNTQEKFELSYAHHGTYTFVSILH